MNEDNTNTESNKPKRGRPSVAVTWPTTEFTAEEVYNSLERKLSRVSIHAKINKAIKSGQLVTCGKIKPRTGRPKTVYKRTDIGESCQYQSPITGA
jgi:predicted ArsR family transcriptional regulator